MKEMNSIKRTIRQIESDPETFEVALKRLEDYRKREKKAKELIKIMKGDVQELQLAADKRTRYYHILEEYFIIFVKHTFQKVLEVRRFQACVEIDMQKRTPDLVVDPQQGSQGRTTSTNLSGGIVTP